MCVNCYHRLGRTKKAWACAHTRKTHYSKGLCKYCYLNAYYKHRTTTVVNGVQTIITTDQLLPTKPLISAIGDDNVEMVNEVVEEENVEMVDEVVQH